MAGSTAALIGDTGALLDYLVDYVLRHERRAMESFGDAGQVSVPAKAHASRRLVSALTDRASASAPEERRGHRAST